ncbi:PQQ-binding-like beta-propeller repeat protein, partial [bacterium]|nr:PQQ-binding-like beta-propeller repeat protein [bacterium]
RSLAWVIRLPAGPTDLDAAGAGLAALGDERGGVYLVNRDGAVLFAGGLPGGGPVRFASTQVTPPGEDEPEKTLVCLGRESFAFLDPTDPEGSIPLPLPLPATSPPAVIGTTLIYGAGETVVALDGEGTELWRYRTGGSLTVEPAVLGGMVWFACGDNRLYGFLPDNPASPLVEYHELGSPPTFLCALPRFGLAAGTAAGELLLLSDGVVTDRMDLGGAPRPGAVLRGRELILPLSWNALAALSLADTPFDPDEPGEEPVTVNWIFHIEPGIRGEATLFAPPESLKLTGRQRSQLAIYLVGRDGRLVVLARGHEPER